MFRLSRRLALVAGAAGLSALLPGRANAQNPQCQLTPAPGTSNALCASTAFVTKSVSGTHQRTALLADTTFFVSTTGSDSTGDGSIGNPWLTGQNAFLQIVSKYDGRGHNVTLQLVGSPFNVPAGQSFIFGNQIPVGMTTITVRGNPASPSAFVIDGTLTGVSAVNLSPSAIGTRLIIDGVKFQNWSSNVISQQTYCFVDIGTVIFANNPGTIFDVESQGTLSGRGGTWTFSGSNGQMCYVSYSLLDTNRAPIVFSAGAAFTFAVLNVDTNGFIHWYNNVTGTCTGNRVFINRGGVIWAELAGGGGIIPLLSLPGSNPGVNNGGWFNNSQLIPGLAVASLPSIGSLNGGERYLVVDATVATFGTIVAGGGGITVPVFNNGTNWIIG